MERSLHVLVLGDGKTGVSRLASGINRGYRDGDGWEGMPEIISDFGRIDVTIDDHNFSFKLSIVDGRSFAISVRCYC